MGGFLLFSQRNKIHGIIETSNKIQIGGNTMYTHKFVKDLKKGQKLDRNYYIVLGGYSSETKTGKEYTFIKVGDVTGEFLVKVWGTNEDIKTVPTQYVGYLLEVSGELQEYKGNVEISLVDIELCTFDDVEGINISDYKKTAPVGRDEMLKELVTTIKEIENEEIQTVVKSVFQEEFKVFEEIPAGRSMHHNYERGLLYHTYTMLLNAKNIVSVYGDEFVDTDVLYGGLILHDVGKVVEYTTEGGQINFTQQGELFGHISIGANMVYSKIKELGINLDESIKLQAVLHLILSHHGNLEWGSPVQPKTVEAHILHIVDMLDSRMDALKREHNKLNTGEIGQRVLMFGNNPLLRHI